MNHDRSKTQAAGPDSFTDIGDSRTGRLPYIFQPENCDTWQNPVGAIRWAEIVNAIIDAGYSGVQIEILGKTPTGLLVWNLHCRRDTPEGRMAEGLGVLAKAGSALVPTSLAISILEDDYRQQGLTVPQKSGKRPETNRHKGHAP